MMLDIDATLTAWEHSLDALAKNMEQRNAAELSYDSVLYQALLVSKTAHGATLAEKVAKGTPEVLAAKKELLEYERRVKAGMEKIRYLEASLNVVKMRQRIESRVV